MHHGLAFTLSEAGATLGDDGIYSGAVASPAGNQSIEREFRERVAAQEYGDYLIAIALGHSIPVMDREVDRFLAAMPQGALILDIGGCWGWHWRRLSTTRPDVGVLIIDFVRGNLLHAGRLLGPLVGTQVALMHADATALAFAAADSEESGFDGVWTVQVFQHIPDFEGACREAHRVLKRGGRFVNYSLHATPLHQFVYWLLGKPFHTRGIVDNSFHFTRANNVQRRIVADVFGDRVTDRDTECLFHRELKLGFPGRARSVVGRFDALLSSAPFLGRWIGRQRSFEVTKR